MQDLAKLQPIFIFIFRTLLCRVDIIVKSFQIVFLTIVIDLL